MSPVIIILSVLWSLIVPYYWLKLRFINFAGYLVVAAFYLAMMLTSALNDAANNV